ncbi:hypothetical protein GCM10010116_61210 [Microbispora rosea subsp. aerata]|nr:hypothetical protein GCM10010116_61210 [Microbispora rosea subsp. aerata]GIH59125.1 hypothetical protein Mro02_60390 [Microbispora rosea subsp. aerata]GLJ86333.1 hypothetical protein GCM10017588_50680 [Microbispora rosea subsp. aerata]
MVGDEERECRVEPCGCGTARSWAGREWPFPAAAEEAGACRTVDGDDLRELSRAIAKQEAVADQTAPRQENRPVKIGPAEPAATRLPHFPVAAGGPGTGPEVGGHDGYRTSADGAQPAQPAQPWVARRCALPARGASSLTWTAVASPASWAIVKMPVMYGSTY